jgi:predicted unusual protein kinase regulating ubiquinone biosynthesis (AarF/ABC1/UbiB family)
MELAQLLTELGPTFIKVGQSLSIRTDLLSPAYVRGLSSLQDNVPPFDTGKAKEILEEEWGQSVKSVLSKIGDKPVAAASLGQVYKATMKDGREVAVKVQRPNIMNQIALDMHLLREFAPLAKRTFNLNTDTVGTVDAWGSGFVDELDYVQEAENGKYFMSRIQETPLKDVVLAPAVVDELTTPKVLVTEWIDGERLDKSSNQDITVLCSICMNTYLTMLLELGVLHCDPHPGNLLRTPEGKLCILDWGMVTRLPSQLQLTLIEHMAHLTSADYAEIPRDLLLLGFIPPSKADAIEDSGVVEVLANIYGQWTAGGGVAAINVNEVINNLQDLTAKKGNLFQIPPYFAYIAKSFSVLEGIGLSNDPKYSIINACLPYVSNRLLTDKESMGPALSTFIFGPNKGNIDTRIVEYDRVEQLVTGFGRFSTSASGALLGKENLSRTQKLEEAAEQVLDIIITEEQTPLQEILLEQLAKIASAGSRSLWTEARARSGTLPSGRSVLGTIVDPLGLFESSPLVNSCEQDEKVVETTRKLVALMSNQLGTADGSTDLADLQRDEVLELSAILGRKVWDRRVALLRTSNRFARKLLDVTAFRLESAERVARPQRTRRPEPFDAETVRDTLPSGRLSAARSRLNALIDDRKDNAVVAEEALPVRTTL